MLKKAAVLVIILLTLVVIVIAGFRSQEMLGKAQAVLETELSQMVAGRVVMGKIESVSWRQIAIDNPQIYDLQDKLVLAAPKLIVNYNLFKLMNSSSVEAVSEIVIEHPQLYLKQSTEGIWNVETLLLQQTEKATTYIGKITIFGGQAQIETNRGDWQVDHLDGEVDFQQRATIAFALQGMQGGQAFHIHGTTGENHRYNLQVKADRIDIETYHALLASDSLKLIEGSLANLTLTASSDGKTLAYSGQGELENIGIDVGSLAFRQANGRIAFTPKSLYLYDCDVLVAGQKVHAGGSVSLDTDQPVFNLHITAEDFDPAAFAVLPVSGNMAFQADVKGTMDQPFVDAQVSMSQGQIGPYTASQAKTKLQLANRSLTLRDFTASMLGGKVMGSGEIELGAETNYNLNLSGEADGAQLADFVPNLIGRVAFQLNINGRGSLSQASMTGNASMSAGSWQDLEFSSLATGFSKQGNMTNLHYLQVGMEQGWLLAEGEVSPELKLQIRGQNLSLGLLQAVGLAADGQADFFGNVSGTPTDPHFAVQLKAKDGRVFDQPFEQAVGAVSGNKQQIELGGLTVTDGKTTHLISGTIGLTGSKELSLTIHTQAARAENLVKLILPDEKLTGWVDNEVYLSGPADNWNASGHITLHEGSFRGYLVEKGEGYYHRDQGVISLQNFNIKSLNSQLSVAGEIQGSNLNLDVKARNIDLGRVFAKYSDTLQGTASFTGKLTGTLQLPEFSGQLQSELVTLNRQSLEKLTGKITVNGPQINIDDFNFYQGQGQYGFEGGINLDTTAVFGYVTVKNGEVAPLLAMLELPVHEVSGLLNGEITVGGTTAKPNLSIKGGIQKGKIKHYVVDQVDLDVVLKDNVLSINNFVAKQATGNLIVRGTADLNGPIDMEIGGRDIDAGILPALWDAGFTATGKLQIAAQITGTTAAPHAAVSMQVNQGSVANADFDNLYGLFIVDKESIHVNQLYLAKGPYRASAYGLIPLKALNATERQQATIADQMDLKLKLDQANLSILPLLTKEVSWATGQTKGEITIGGTLAQPTLNGQILVENGTIKLAALGQPIQKVEVAIQLEGDKIVVNSFTGQLGGGAYQLTGTASLKGLSLDNYNFILSLDKLGIDSQYFKGPINGSLFLASVGGIPKITGKILLENDIINIPFIPQLTKADTDMALDVELVAGKRVRLYNSYLYDIMLDGKVRFGGTLSLPQASGHLHALNGSVSYLRTQFKVTEAEADFIQYASFEPIIKLSAQTSLDQTRINLNLSGPLSQIEMKLTSEPAMSQQEILSLLTLRSRYFDKQKNSGSSRDAGLGRDEVVSLLDAGLQMRFISTLENTLKNALGLDQFRLVRSTLSVDNQDKSDANDRSNDTNREVYNIEIAKYVTDRLLLSYSAGVDNKTHSMGFQYDVTRRMSFTGSVDEQNRRRLGLEMRFNFK